MNLFIYKYKGEIWLSKIKPVTTKADSNEHGNPVWRSQLKRLLWCQGQNNRHRECRFQVKMAWLMPCSDINGIIYADFTMMLLRKPDIFMSGLFSLTRPLHNTSEGTRDAKIKLILKNGIDHAWLFVKLASLMSTFSWKRQSQCRFLNST